MDPRDPRGAGAGEDVDLAKYFFRTIMRFETGAPYLEALNRTLAVTRRTAGAEGPTQRLNAAVRPQRRQSERPT